ncbi:MAG: hypothetical protein P4L67_04480 [Candidatus Pacebacteria bacterium]|nr:hypothetical protein [Candidatus Paceibacterota bacterium]
MTKDDKPKPTGHVNPVRVLARGRTSPHAVYATVVCEDEDGTEWSFDVAAFNFDLKPNRGEGKP